VNTHPTKWSILATEENHAELNRWRLSKRESKASRWDDKFVPGSFLVSEHPFDGSYFFLDEWRPSESNYQEITLENFREITNSKPMKHPEKWYIPVTEKNHAELNQWRLKVATSYREMKLNPYDSVVVSAHHRDGSYFYASDVKALKAHDAYNDYQEITLEQFREITNSNQTTMSKLIQISRKLLNEYYDAATTPQKEYLIKYFKLDGTTTVEAIRGLHDMACEDWKPKIKKNHPDCFPITKYFDFSKHVNKKDKFIVSEDVCKSLGLQDDFIQVRNSCNQELDQRSFYLTTNYNWELVQDDHVMVLVPTKKSSK
jgi:hypothetical protein